MGKSFINFTKEPVCRKCVMYMQSTIFQQCLNVCLAHLRDDELSFLEVYSWKISFSFVLTSKRKFECDIFKLNCLTCPLYIWQWL